MDPILYPPKWFILNFLPCPSCNSQLEPKPVLGEWNNVFCTFCNFACRLVTTPNRPQDKILAVRKSELEDLLQLKRMLPPLMIHFKWELGGTAREQVEFWPFVAYRFLKEEHLHPIGLKPDEVPDVEVFKNLFELPQITLYESPSVEEIAEQIVKTWQLPIHTAQIQRDFNVTYYRAAVIREKVQERLLQLGKTTEEDPDPDPEWS